MERLQNAFNTLRPTEAQEERMLREILIARGEPVRKRRRNNPVRVAALLAAALALTAVTASAAEALGVSQMIRDYFQQKEEVNVMDTLNLAASGLSVSTDDGWTITITDLFGDENRFLAGVTVEAPEGTILDRSDYSLVMTSQGTPHTLDCFLTQSLNEDGSPQIEDGYLQSNRWYAKQIEDDNPNDNKVSFVFDSPLCYYQDGINVDFTFVEMFWYEKFDDIMKRSIKHTPKEFNVTIPNISTHFSTNGYHLTPNVALEAFDGTAILSKLTLTPLSISYALTGDAVKTQFFDIHEFFGTDRCNNMSDEERDAYLDSFQPTRKERFIREDYPAPVWGWHSVWYKDIPVVIHFKDGTAQELVFDDMDDDMELHTESYPKTHTIQVSRNFDGLFDLSQIDYLTICDVRIELPAEP